MAAVYNCIFSLQNTEKQLRLLSKLVSVLTGEYCSTYGRVLEKLYRKLDKNNISQAVFKWIEDNLRNGIINT